MELPERAPIPRVYRPPVCAYAAGTLCGNKPGETYCPPDNNFVPDNPNWYVYITQPYAEYPDYLQGVTYTLVDWSAQGVRAFTDLASPHCRPVLTGTSANCRTLVGTLQEDVIYVPDSTYEAETEVPNLSCPFYTGNRTVDYWNGCFSAYYAISNFPSAYVDTTASDSGGKYSATIGTYAGAALNASSSYYNYVYFDARGETLALLTFQTTRTRGQVGSRIPASCYSPFCVFGVDTSGTIDSAPLLPLL